MADILNNIEELVDKDEKLIDIWGRRTPKFEKKYEQSVMRVISDYGVGASENTGAKGKILGAGYEPYIMAFFIGLYSNKRLPLSDDSDDLKVLGQPLQYWGNLDSKKFRHAYPALRSYMFIALVAKLIETMEEYANYGFSVMEDKLREDKGYFFFHRSFLDIFIQLTTKKSITVDSDDTPEEL